MENKDAIQLALIYSNCLIAVSNSEQVDIAVFTGSNNSITPAPLAIKLADQLFAKCMERLETIAVVSNLTTD